MRGWGVIAALAACLATAVANAGPQQEVGNLVGAVSKTLARETRTVGGTVADAGTSLGNTVTGTSTAGGASPSYEPGWMTRAVVAGGLP